MLYIVIHIHISVFVYDTMIEYISVFVYDTFGRVPKSHRRETVVEQAADLCRDFSLAPVLQTGQAVELIDSSSSCINGPCSSIFHSCVK